MMKRRSGERSPSECRPLTNVPSGPSCFSAAAPMRVMIRMLATTYGLSVISTPTLESGEPSGPMTYGMTYMVRPRIAPSNSAPTFRFASAGAIRSEEHTSELQSLRHLVCRLLLEKKNKHNAKEACQRDPPTRADYRNPLDAPWHSFDDQHVLSQTDMAEIDVSRDFGRESRTRTTW